MRNRELYITKSVINYINSTIFVLITLENYRVFLSSRLWNQLDKKNNDFDCSCFRFVQMKYPTGVLRVVFVLSPIKLSCSLCYLTEMLELLPPPLYVTLLVICDTKGWICYFPTKRYVMCKHPTWNYKNDDVIILCWLKISNILSQC